MHLWKLQRLGSEIRSVCPGLHHILIQLVSPGLLHYHDIIQKVSQPSALIRPVIFLSNTRLPKPVSYFILFWDFRALRLLDFLSRKKDELALYLRLSNSNFYFEKSNKILKKDPKFLRFFLRFRIVLFIFLFPSKRVSFFETVTFSHGHLRVFQSDS